MTVRRLILSALTLLLTGFSQSGNAQSVAGQIITLEDAIDLALKNNPALRLTQAAEISAEAGLRQARADYYPQLTASASATYSESEATSGRTSSDTRNYSTGIALQQLLWDFGRTSGKVRSASQIREQIEAENQAIRSNIVLNATLAYADVVRAIQAEVVARQSVEAAGRHLEQAQQFVRAGRRTQLDITRAEVDLENARLGEIRAINSVQVARLQLNNAIGFDGSGSFAVTDSIALEQFDLPLDSLKALAEERRPEIIAARKRVEIARASLTVVSARHYPTLSASGGLTWSNSEFPLKNRSVAGLTLSLPLFSGFETNSSVQQARATLQTAEVNLEIARKALSLEVEQHYLALVEIRQRIGVAVKLIERAAENRQLVERQYAVGIGALLDVTDAELNYSNAVLTRITAYYDYVTGLARLKRAAGIL